MLAPVLVGHLDAVVAQVLLEGRVHDQLLADGVAGQAPRELVLPARLLVMVHGRQAVAVRLLERRVVLPHGLGDANHLHGGGGEVARGRGDGEAPGGQGPQGAEQGGAAWGDHGDSS